MRVLLLGAKHLFVAAWNGNFPLGQLRIPMFMTTISNSTKPTTRDYGSSNSKCRRSAVRHPNTDSGCCRALRWHGTAATDKVEDDED